MWQRWFKSQCVAVGWKATWGYPLREAYESRDGWSRARAALTRVEIGHKVVVQLQNHRFGRVGEVTGLAVEDGLWNPLVPRTVHDPDGEMGRRIQVRWDLNVGPDDRDMVVKVPESNRLTPGELRATVCRIRSQTWSEIVRVMDDPSNWVGLMTKFDYESALSGYVAAYPHRLEDGLLPHPSLKVRERVFGDRKNRSDVLLIDRAGKTVIVECKQHSPSIDDIQQLRGYLREYKTELIRLREWILVHGGAKNLSSEVRTACEMSPAVELMQYRLEVDFSACR